LKKGHGIVAAVWKLCPSLYTWKWS